MIFGFDENTAKELMSAKRTVAAHPFGSQQPRENSSIGALTNHTVVLKVTSVTTSNGFYPCRWCSTTILNAGSPAITFTPESSDGWVYGLNGATLVLDNFYFGQFRGYKSDDNKAVFVVGSGGSGGGTPLTVREADGTPTVLNVTEITLANPNISVVQTSAGKVTIDTVGFTGNMVQNVVCNANGTITLTLRSCVNGVVK